MSKVENVGNGGPRVRVPPEQLSLSFEDIRFETTKGKCILKDITGYVAAGELCGVLGPSGSGKTCLLDVLAMRKKKGGSLKEGKVLFGGKPLKPHLKGNSVCYIGQEDVLLASFTVRETVAYAVRLDHGFSLTKSAFTALVDGILDDIGLRSASDVRVGNPASGKGISGGQRRRLMIAVELVSCPAVMIVDEITSGLDFASAFGVMKELQSLAKIGHTVLTVIHQPSSQIWSLFDRVVFLSQGSIAYFGTPDQLLPYFEGLGHNCPEFYNPAEFVMELLQPPSSDLEPASQEADLVSKFAESKLLEEIKVRIQEEILKAPRDSKVASFESTSVIFKLENDESRPASSATSGLAALPPSKPQQSPSSSSSSHPGFLVSTLVLLHRNLFDLMRNPSILLVRVALVSVISVLLGLTFLRVGDRFTDEAIRSRSSALFFLPSFTSMVSLAMIPNFMASRAVVKKEIGNGRYSIWAFAASFIVPIIISSSALAITVSIISFYMLGFRNFGEYFLATFANYLLIEVMVLAAGAIVSHYLIGMLLALSVLAGGMSVQGYFIVFHRVNESVRWLGYVTPNRYTFRALMRNEFETMGNLTSLFYPTGRDYLDFFGYYGREAFESFWIDVAIIFTFAAGFFGAFLLALMTWRL